MITPLKDATYPIAAFHALTITQSTVFLREHMNGEEVTTT